MVTRSEMEKRLRCDMLLEEIPNEFKQLAETMAVQYVNFYSVKGIDAGMFANEKYSNEEYYGFGYRLSKRLTQNRIEHLMYDELLANPRLTATEFADLYKLSDIFIDMDAIINFIDLAKDDNNDFFVYLYHFFSITVFSYIKRHPFYVSMINKAEVVSVLYEQVYFAIKRCAKNGKNFSFSTLERLFNAAVIELAGTERLVYTLHRKDMAQYFRFRAIVTNNDYGIDEIELVARILKISIEKAIIYWEIFVAEGSGYISALQLYDDEKGENSYGMAIEMGFYEVEMIEIRNKLFQSEIDRNIFDFLVINGSRKFTKKEITDLNTTRYHINQVIEIIRNFLNT